MIVHADNVWKRFGRVAALQGLSFRVPEGSIFALIGANGAGKTTTIKVLVNILEPTVGDATVLGVASRTLSPTELAQIGYVSEHQDMPGRMTVSAYLDYLRPFYPSWDRTLEADILSQFPLPPTRRIKDLSHGMRLKMALACALPFRPRLLVLDEPFSGLDPLVRDELMERLKRQAGDMTVLMSSHELAEIEDVTYSLTVFHLEAANTMAAMNGDGRFAALGWCKTKIDEDGDEIELGCIKTGGAPTCVSATLENPANGKRNPENWYCDPDYAPYRVHVHPDTMSQLGGGMRFRDSQGLARYPVDASQLVDAQVTLKSFRPQAHFTRRLVIPDIRLSEWTASAAADDTWRR